MQLPWSCDQLRDLYYKHETPSELFKTDYLIFTKPIHIYSINHLMKFFLAFFCFACLAASAQEKNAKPKIGLTFSGGGAKGLAHIGILKAIDSAGLKVDYITGTSMGAIVGGLYASGYSGNEIEKLAREIDWDVLLSNNIPLQALSMEEKEQYKRYAVELPFINQKIRLPQTGYIKGQELNAKFSELFFHVHDVRNFNNLPIPFKCMATDLETGKLVVLDTGNIVSALRSTMAIPSVFSAVTRDDKKLVDGGLVRNFPVKNVKAMGADIVIGSNVTNGLSKIEKIKNPVDVLMQMAFFKESEDFKEELPLTNIYIHMPLEKYNTASFGSVDEIMEEGIKTGLAYYPIFKKLADSINALGAPEVKIEKPIFNKPIFITEYRVTGLSLTSVPFFVHLMDFDDHRYYTAAQISKSIRRANGSMYYSSISYTLEPNGKDSARIIFNVEENPSTFLKAGVYYTKFRGINANLNLTSRDFFIHNSRSMIAVSLGESLQLEAEHLQYLGRIKNVAFIAGVKMDIQDINSYVNYKIDGGYKQKFFRGFLNFQNSGGNRLAAGTGTAIENIRYSPNIHSTTEARGNFTSLRTYVYLKYNSLNQPLYPTRGLKLHTELAYVYNQNPNLQFFQNGVQVADPDFNNFTRLSFDGSLFTRINARVTLLSELQAGINFTDKPNVLNNFQVGGIDGNFRNQVRFAGLPEASINSSAVAALQLGLRYEIANNAYIIGRANALFKDFATTKISTSAGTWLTGYSLTFAYKSPIGPLELSAMYSDQSKRLQPYVLFGIPF